MTRKLALAPVFLLLAFVQDDPELARQAAKHKADVTRIRGLQFKKDVKVGVYTKDELVDFLKNELKRELPREKSLKLQKAYAHLGLIPEDMNLYDSLLTLFSSGIAGFYHPETKELRLIKSGQGGQELEKKAMKAMGMDIDAMTMVHELCHAAQDQHFTLSTLPLEDETNDDLLAAIKAVVEGDASVVGMKFMLKERFDQMIGMMNAGYKMGALPGEAGNLPRYLRLTLTFPYGHGTDFVLQYIKQHNSDPSKANDLFGKFPTSTEQILHPEKYFGDEPDWPTLLTFPDIRKTLGVHDEILLSNVHGEFALGILLREIRAGRSRTRRRAARGWDGDRYVVFEEDDGAVYSVWYTTWDSVKDAQEFQAAYAKGIEKKYGEAELAKDNELLKVWKMDDRRVLIERREEDVLVLDNVRKKLLRKVGAIFSDVRKSELKTVERVKPTHKWYSPK